MKKKLSLKDEALPLLIFIAGLAILAIVGLLLSTCFGN